MNAEPQQTKVPGARGFQSAPSRPIRKGGAVCGAEGLLLRPERIGGVHDLHKQAVAERRDGVVRTHLCAAVRAALRPSTMLLGFILSRGDRLRQFGRSEFK